MKNRFDATQSLIYAVKRVYLLANQRADALLQPYGLGRTQWHIVYHLAEHGRMGQRQLQDILQIESATLSGIIASMVQKGWVEQLPSMLDKRRKDLSLTPKGFRLRKSIPDPVSLLEQAAYKDLPVQDLAQARRLLEKVAKNLEQ